MVLVKLVSVTIMTIKFCIFIVLSISIFSCDSKLYEQFSDASSSKGNADIFVIGLFSLCQNETNSFPYYDQKNILNSYLHFERTVTFYQTIYNVSYGKIGSISYDVCRNQSRLLEVITGLSLSGKYLLEPRNATRFAHANYIAIYGFLTVPLLKLSLELLSWIEVPYFVILPDDEQASYLPITQYQHLGKTAMIENKVIERLFTSYYWQSFTFVLLSSNELYIKRVDSLIEKLIAEKRSTCIVKMLAFNPSKVDETVQLLANQTSRKVVYVMGNSVQTEIFLQTLDRFKVYNRIIFLDSRAVDVKVPERLQKGLFFVPSLGNYAFELYENESKRTSVPDSFPFPVCKNGFFRNTELMDSKDDICLENSNLTLVQWNRQQNDTSSVSETLSHAVLFPYWEIYEASRWLPKIEHYNITDQPDQLRYISRSINRKFREWLHGSHYILNMQKPGAVHTCLIHWFPSTCIFRGRKFPVTWPGPWNEIPRQYSCFEEKILPAGQTTQYGVIPQNETQWDLEYGYRLVKCAFGWYKENAEDFPCQPCPEGLVSSPDRTACIDQYTRISVFGFNTKESLIFSMLIFIGFVISLSYCVCLIVHRKTAVVKSSQFKFTLLQLLSHFFDFFCLMYAFAYHNDNTACMLLTVGVGFLLSLNLALAIIKTQIIIDIFYAKTKIDHEQQLKRNYRNAFIIGIIVSVSVSLSVITIVFHNPDAIGEIINQDLKFGFCDFGHHLQVQFGYSIILSIICTVQSIRARHLPDFFKSTRFIVYGMFTNLMTMVAFYTVYNNQRGNRIVQFYAMGFAAVFSNYAFLLIVHTNRILSIFNRKRNTQTVVRRQIRLNMEKLNENVKIRTLPQQ